MLIKSAYTPYIIFEIYHVKYTNLVQSYTWPHFQYMRKSHEFTQISYKYHIYTMLSFAYKPYRIFEIYHVKYTNFSSILYLATL